MDFKTTLAFALMILIYFYFFQPIPQPSVPTPTASNILSDTTAQNTLAAPKVSTTNIKEAPKPDSVQTLKDQIFQMSNEKVLLRIDGTGSIRSVQFFDYVDNPKSQKLVEFNFGGLGLNSDYLTTSEGAPVWAVTEKTNTRIILDGKISGVQVRRKIELLPLTYLVTFIDEINNQSLKTVETTASVLLQHPIPKDYKAPGFFKTLFQPQTDLQEVVFFRDGATTRVGFDSIGPVEEQTEPLSWTGYSRKYFFFGVVPQNVSFQTLKYYRSESGDGIFEDLSLTKKQLTPGQHSTYSYYIYIGPKEIPELKKASPELPKVIDYGDWIGPIARFFHSLLAFFYSLMPNYGIAIILLTILVKTCLFPLAYKAAVSARKMQVLAPKLQEIRNRYKDDKHRVGAETMALWKSEKVNPFGACLPMLVQLPIFIALYRVFFASIELRQAPFLGWVQDLSSHDPLFVTPVLMSGLMWYQMHLTPMPAMDETNETMRAQRAMMKWMPVIFGGMMLFLPSGLTLYFLVSALISIIQQLYLNKHLNLKFPIEIAAKK